jgi:hypothetical protein
VKTSGAFREASDVLRHGYPRYLPAIAITWILVEVAGRQVARAPDVARVGLLLASLGFYTGAAASLRSGRNENPFWLGLSRASGAIDLFLIALLVAALGCLGVGVAMLTGGGDGALFIALVVPVLAGLGAVSRLWPILAVPYLYKGKIAWSPAARGSAWRGPGLGTAWRMTAREGTFLRVSLPVLSASLLLLAVPIVMRLLWGTGLVDSLMLYGGVLPFLTTLVLVASEPLVLQSR